MKTPLKLHVGDVVRINAPQEEFLSKYNGTITRLVASQTRLDGWDGWELEISRAYIFKEE